MRLTSNPARDLATIKGANQTKDRVLSIAELRAYWNRIFDSPLLQFHLLSGGQRIDQLRRLTVNDWDTDTQTITFGDPKGNREHPRIHVIPLLSQAKSALDEMRGGQLGPFLWTLNGGEHGASYTTAKNALKKVIKVMMETGEATAPFTLGDLRRTVETRLAAAGISSDIRAQLQSHGLGGVQQRHYNRHSYLDEKRAALEKLDALLTETATIIQLKTA